MLYALLRELRSKEIPGLTIKLVKKGFLRICSFYDIPDILGNGIHWS